MSDRGIREDGTASDLFKDRAAFAAAWSRIEPQVTDSDLLAHRRQRAWTAWKYRMFDWGCRMPTQMSSGLSQSGAGVYGAGLTIINSGSIGGGVSGSGVQANAHLWPPRPHETLRKKR